MGNPGKQRLGSPLAILQRLGLCCLPLCVGTCWQSISPLFRSSWRGCRTPRYFLRGWGSPRASGQGSPWAHKWHSAEPAGLCRNTAGPAAALSRCIPGRWRRLVPRAGAAPEPWELRGAVLPSAGSARRGQRRGKAAPGPGGLFLFALLVCVLDGVFAGWGFPRFGLVCFALFCFDSRCGLDGGSSFGHGGWVNGWGCHPSLLHRNSRYAYSSATGRSWALLGPAGHSLEQLALVMVGFNFGCSSARAVWGHKLCSRESFEGHWQGRILKTPHISSKWMARHTEFEANIFCSKATEFLTDWYCGCLRPDIPWHRLFR